MISIQANITDELTKILYEMEALGIISHYQLKDLLQEIKEKKPTTH